MYTKTKQINKNKKQKTKLGAKQQAAPLKLHSKQSSQSPLQAEWSVCPSPTASQSILVMVLPHMEFNYTMI